jgi:2-polyprenyl-6-methoxyphenol hydroxylase-like FAD-dependent oxidoreductase
MVGRRGAIAGGGIGGLAAAPGLAKKGYDVIVLEKAPALGEIGAGIQRGDAFRTRFKNPYAVVHRGDLRLTTRRHVSGCDHE